jgi:hypothetical protein
MTEALSACQTAPAWDRQAHTRWRIRLAILETDAIRQAITVPNVMGVCETETRGRSRATTHKMKYVFST